LIDAAAVAGRKFFLKRIHFAHHGVQEAERLFAARAPQSIGAAVAEQTLEDDLRIVLHGQRRGWALPGNRIAVCTAQAVAAAQARVFDSQFE
jgi:hypothetical protein